MLEYIRNIAIFIIMEGLILSAVTNESFKKIVKIFSGMILIIIVLSPLDNIFNITDLINTHFYEWDKKESINEIISSIENTNEENVANVKKQYENIVFDDVNSVAVKEGYMVTSVNVTFDDSKSNYIGSVEIYISKEEETFEENMVEVVKVGSIKLNDGNDDEVKSTDYNPSIINIKNYIVDQYGVDYKNIIITTDGGLS